MATMQSSRMSRARRAVSTRGRQMRASTAAAEMTRDPRPPILYFRSFGGDKFSCFSLNFTFEEVLATVFHDAEPVVAIGRPDEPLPPVGAAGMQVGNDQWQAAVTSLLEDPGSVAGAGNNARRLSSATA